MMNKDELLSTLSAYLRSGIISRQEVLSACGLNASAPAPTAPVIPTAQTQTKKIFSATTILYIVGGLILLVGIGTLLFRFWSDLSGIVRIVLTLGIGVATYISGILLRSKDKTFGIGDIMQIVSGILVPVGIFVTLHEAGLQDITVSWSTSVALLLTLIYVASLLIFRSTVFAFFSIAFSTWAIYSCVAYALSVVGTSVLTSDIYQYLTLAVGAGYLFLASYVRKTPHAGLASIIDTVGSLGIFGALLALSGYRYSKSIIWEFISVLSLCGGLYLASFTENKAILKSTALFIFIFIAKFTAEYFADSFGWPIALIIGGLILIGVGFALVKFNKRIGKH